ncbi:hypothetical protein [Thermostichus vulcanus]|uniref:Uncharacterized protein n=1 Tax=Thermostichus vulcanus str. 'Rupite' TaxID=2813851 RepID=A0ABT0C7F0_THEVL|nr:hypothetical protein [Thermostichus vulcanus]MCJ2541719.1 hypothetical protein [Thermostichus vulcanus str. 'Rupite']
MNILRQYVFPALILLVFLFTLVVVSIRSFLPGDMAQPAPIEDLTPIASSTALMAENA